MPDIVGLKIEPKININLSRSKSRVGILNKGEDNKFHDITSEGLDIAILDEGRRTEVKNLSVK